MLKIIDENFNLHSRKIPGQTKGMLVKSAASLTYVDSGLSCDTFNIIHITDGTQLTEQEFFQAVSHFRNKSFAFCIWINSENLSPGVKALFTKGSVSQQNVEPGMVLDMTKWEPIKDVHHDNIVIANTATAVKDFAEVVAVNWTPPDENVRKYFTITAERYLYQKLGFQTKTRYDEFA